METIRVPEQWVRSKGSPGQPQEVLWEDHSAVLVHGSGFSRKLIREDLQGVAKWVIMVRMWQRTLPGHQPGTALPHPLPGNTQGERLLFALERLEEILLLCLRRAGGKEQLSLIQAQILLQVARNLEPIRLTELHRVLGVSKPSLSKSVNRLVAKRYLRIVETPGDRRSRWLSLTPKGLSLLRKIQGELMPLLRLMERYGTRYPEYYRITLEILREAQALGLIPKQKMCLTCAYYEEREQGRGYCHFLRIPLPPGELRILCPDHQEAARASG